MAIYDWTGGELPQATVFLDGEEIEHVRWVDTNKGLVCRNVLNDDGLLYVVWPSMEIAQETLTGRHVLIKFDTGKWFAANVGPCGHEWGDEDSIGYTAVSPPKRVRRIILD